MRLHPNLDRIGAEYLAAAAAHEARRTADRVAGRPPRPGERRHEPERSEAEWAAHWLASTPTPEQCAAANAEHEAAQVRLADGLRPSRARHRRRRGASRRWRGRIRLSAPSGTEEDKPKTPVLPCCGVKLRGTGAAA